jgi:isopentenyl diphosphate isomerase/L-lactate dehydrogenase-like FMN-dependent dehydrogenase
MSVSSMPVGRTVSRSRNLIRYSLLAAFLYVLKGAGTSSTCAENRRALDRWKLVPRMLNDVGERNLEV